MLGTSDKPLTAYEIAGEISDKRKVHGVEVYRALEFLQAAGCIHRLASWSSCFACDHLHGEGDAPLLSWSARSAVPSMKWDRNWLHAD
ncbi:hypothetical protein [Bradyrhizobium tropiciagri]|uniref:hypothetical protein n=1 Tax=Bradyrhizobium tropiciagri TaxID=312253 RepID=UPI003D318D93